MNKWLAAFVVVLSAAEVDAADLKPATVAAFERYQRLAESAIESDVATTGHFLRIFRGDAARQREIERQLRQGQVAVERLAVSDNGKRIDVPDGLIHHWVGAVFVPNVHADAAVALMQDYDRHAQFFKPNVVRSQILEHDGDHFRVFLRFYFKKVIAVTVNTESTAVFTRHDADRVSSMIRSTKVTEVENPGTSNERELPVGRDSGYLWRLNTYWRFWERDGGTYIECESLTLTRGIPIGFGWIIGPFVTSIPRETLTMTLNATRRVLTHEVMSGPAGSAWFVAVRSLARLGRMGRVTLANLPDPR